MINLSQNPSTRAVARKFEMIESENGCGYMCQSVDVVADFALVFFALYIFNHSFVDS